MKQIQHHELIRYSSGLQSQFESTPLVTGWWLAICWKYILSEQACVMVEQNRNPRVVTDGSSAMHL